MSDSPDNNSQDQEKQRTLPLLVERRPGESDASFRSRRNHIYGRRFHEKKHQQIADLTDQKRVLEESIRVTRCDNERLKNLLKQAHFVVSEYNGEETRSNTPI
eukprot:scaffold34590_cov183-Amphora_coffeaeformis.AAC.3